MNASREASVPLFSYGTLQLPEVQRATYDRLLDGKPDVMVGYRLIPLTITKKEVVALSGAPVHMIACRTGDPADRIAGIVYTITPAELAATDDYEGDAYARVEVRLESGATAFVYIGPDAFLRSITLAIEQGATGRLASHHRIAAVTRIPTRPSTSAPNGMRAASPSAFAAKIAIASGQAQRRRANAPRLASAMTKARPRKPRPTAGPISSS